MRHNLKIHERFLMHIWSKQYLARNMKTCDGKNLKVIETGELNLDGGPDFKNARVKIGDITYIGDIEIHRNILDWLRHKHQEDPRYNKVILHVVLRSQNDFLPTITQSGREIPVLFLDKFLPESIQSIWQKAILDERMLHRNTITCFDKNRHLSTMLIEKWLSKLSIERLELKLHRFEERLHELAYERLMSVCEDKIKYCLVPEEGNYEEVPFPLVNLKITQKHLTVRSIWEQLLYEGIMEGLGYSKNRTPFIKLAQNLNLQLIKSKNLNNEEVCIQALLFGFAGLLPEEKEVYDEEERNYIRSLKLEWLKLLPLIKCEILNKADWQFFCARPSNFPTIKIAAACKIVKKFLSEDIFRNTIQTIKAQTTALKKITSLINLLKPDRDNFWEHHYTFERKTIKKQNLLGVSRIQEIIVNSILPVTLLYARVFKDTQARQGALDIYKTLKTKDTNYIIRLMDKQLVRGKLDLTKICNQQALIQLYKYYCNDNKCKECEFGKIILKH